MKSAVRGLICGVLLLAACGSDTKSSTPPATSPANSTQGTSTGSGSSVASGTGTAGTDQRFPDIVDVAPTASGDGTWTFAVTVSSPYDSPERYADGWRVLGPDGTVFGEHTLTHDHATEQPFTRTQSGVQIPSDVRSVTVEGRDQANGYGGATILVELSAA